MTQKPLLPLGYSSLLPLPCKLFTHSAWLSSLFHLKWAWVLTACWVTHGGQNKIRLVKLFYFKEDASDAKIVLKTFTFGYFKLLGRQKSNPPSFLWALGIDSQPLASIKLLFHEDFDVFVAAFRIFNAVLNSSASKNKGPTIHLHPIMTWWKVSYVSFLNSFLKVHGGAAGFFYHKRHFFWKCKFLSARGVAAGVCFLAKICDSSENHNFPPPARCRRRPFSLPKQFFLSQRRFFRLVASRRRFFRPPKFFLMKRVYPIGIYKIR